MTPLPFTKLRLHRHDALDNGDLNEIIINRLQLLHFQGLIDCFLCHNVIIHADVH